MIGRTNAEEESPEAILSLVAASRPVTVTEVAAFHGDPVAGARNLVRPRVPLRPGQESTLAGTALHLWIERYLRRLSSGGSDLDDSVDEPIPAKLSVDDHRLLVSLQRSIRDMRLTDDLEIVGVEVPFSLNEEGRAIRGRIDAVFKDRDGNAYVLVDWKTSKTRRTRLSHGPAIPSPTEVLPTSLDDDCRC